MFAIHAPQSVTLITPGEDNLTVLNFRTAGADTSRCLLELITPAGDVHRLTFNQRGRMVDQQFIRKDDVESDTNPVLTGAHIVDGRDTRSDDPYTHVAPATHGDPVLDAGGLQPDVFDADGKPAVTPEMREHALEEAAARARGDRDEKEGDDYEEQEPAAAPYQDPPLHEYEKSAGYPTDTGELKTTSPGPNPFKDAPPLRNRMTPPDRVNTTETLRNG